MNRLQPTAYFLIVLVLGTIILKEGAFILVPLVWGIFFAFALYPISSWLERKRIPRGLAIFLSILMVSLVVFGIIYLVANYTVISNIDRELGLETDKHKDQIFLVNSEIRFLHMGEWEEMEHSQIQLNPIFIEIVDL